MLQDVYERDQPAKAQVSNVHDAKSPALPLPFSPSLKVWKGFLPSPVKAWKGFLPSSLPVSLDIAGVYDSRAAPSSWRLCKSTPDNEKVATPRGPQCQALRGEEKEVAARVAQWSASGHRSGRQDRTEATWRERGGESRIRQAPFWGTTRIRAAHICAVAAALSQTATVIFPFSLVRTGRPPKYGLACASAS